MFQKNTPKLFFEYLCQTSSDFDKIWYTPSQLNLLCSRMSIPHLTLPVYLHYLVKPEKLHFCCKFTENQQCVNWFAQKLTNCIIWIKAFTIYLFISKTRRKQLQKLVKINCNTSERAAHKNDVILHAFERVATECCVNCRDRV